MFLSVDPVTAYSNPVGQFHRYRYANNNPYRFTDPDGRCAASRLQAVCAMGATMFNSSGLRAQPSFRQAQMVRIVSDGHGSANSAAVAFGKATQEEARDSQREPQAGIVRSGDDNYAYTKPMWGAPDDTTVDVKQYVDALTYVYGSSAIGLVHTHFDDNMKFSPVDLAPFKTARNRLLFMHNQNGETRRIDERIFRRTLRDADSLNLMEYLNRHKDGMEGICVGGC